MTSALKSGMTSQRISSRRSVSASHSLEVVPSLSSRRRSSRLRQSVTLPAAVNQQVVTPLPQTQAPPAWLRLLVRAQKTSSVVVFVLVVATLSVYGWTVYIQQHWGEEYRRFETLKKQERQLISGNEALKNQIARQAESPLSGLTVPDPNNTIFLTPAAPRSPETPNRPSSSQPTSSTRPIGY